MKHQRSHLSWALALMTCCGFSLIGCNNKSSTPKAKVSPASIAKQAQKEAKDTPKVPANGKEELAAAAANKAAKAKTQNAAKAAAAAPSAGAAVGAPTDWAVVLKDPSKATATAPEVYRVKMHTSKGDFVVTVHRKWAPNGADRFYNLVKAGFYKDIAFFRAVPNFMVQFGIHGVPALNMVWRNASFKDDPVTQKNARGTITFATRGPNTRTSQLFINFKDNSFLDRMGFSPFGQVSTDDMKVVDSIHQGYGEGPPRGKGPNQMRMQTEGNAYLKRDFDKLDYLLEATVLDAK